ncbi:MAG: hypothetical protein IPO81_08220 [Kouleothrix sp.]|nr:hypothetical protein [Kouleothrix sp.]
MTIRLLRSHRRLFALTLSLMMMALVVGTAAAKSRTFKFDMVRSSAAEAAKCLPKASGDVKVTELGPVEILDLKVSHLAPNTTYSFFVLQVPDKPFGIGWYNGEIETNSAGNGHQRFIGRFNDETFAIAPGSTAAPVVHTDQPFPDASENPAFAPVHTFHLGLWFSDPQDAAKAGCTDAVTPFDGDHIAGIQVLSTRQFKPDQGPLRKVAP